MDTLYAYRGSRKVAELSLDAATRRLDYAEDWSRDVVAPPISPLLPKGELAEKSRSVEVFFRNLLPEGAYLETVSRYYRISSGNTFDLLAALGSDLPTFFTLLREDRPADASAGYEIVQHGQLIRANNAGYRLDINDSLGIRMSLAGAQMKYGICVDDAGTFLRPMGSATSTHILKPSIDDTAGIPYSSLNEFVISRLAGVCGMSVPEAAYLPEHRSLLLKRFDRVATNDGFIERLAQWDFCQLTDRFPTQKYQNEGGPALLECAEAIDKYSSIPVLDRRELIRWVAFNWGIGNADAHAKNIALLHNNGQTRMTPHYDLLSTLIYNSLSDKMTMKIGGEYRPDHVMKRHWERFAEEIGASQKAALSDAKRMVEAIIQNASITLIPGNLSEDESDFATDLLEKVKANAENRLIQLSA